MFWQSDIKSEEQDGFQETQVKDRPILQPSKLALLVVIKKASLMQLAMIDLDSTASAHAFPQITVKSFLHCWVLCLFSRLVNFPPEFAVLLHDFVVWLPAHLMYFGVRLQKFSDVRVISNYCNVEFSLFRSQAWQILSNEANSYNFQYL